MRHFTNVALIAISIVCCCNLNSWGNSPVESTNVLQPASSETTNGETEVDIAKLFPNVSLEDSHPTRKKFQKPFPSGLDLLDDPSLGIQDIINNPSLAVYLDKTDNPGDLFSNTESEFPRQLPLQTTLTDSAQVAFLAAECKCGEDCQCKQEGQRCTSCKCGESCGCISNDNAALTHFPNITRFNPPKCCTTSSCPAGERHSLGFHPLRTAMLMGNDELHRLRRDLAESRIENTLLRARLEAQQELSEQRLEWMEELTQSLVKNARLETIVDLKRNAQSEISASPPGRFQLMNKQANCADDKNHPAVNSPLDLEREIESLRAELTALKSELRR